MRDKKQFDNLKSWFRLFLQKYSKNSLLGVIRKSEQMFARTSVRYDYNAAASVGRKPVARKEYDEIR